MERLGPVSLCRVPASASSECSGLKRHSDVAVSPNTTVDDINPALP